MNINNWKNMRVLRCGRGRRIVIPNAFKSNNQQFSAIVRIALRREYYGNLRLTHTQYIHIWGMLVNSGDGLSDFFRFSLTLVCLSFFVGSNHIGRLNIFPAKSAFLSLFEPISRLTPRDLKTTLRCMVSA